MREQSRVPAQGHGRPASAGEKSRPGQRETRSRGRIDALAKRLDEMHQTWAGAPREAVAGAGRPEEWSHVGDRMARIKDLPGAGSQAVGELRDWATARAPADETSRVEERLGAMVLPPRGSLHDQMANRTAAAGSTRAPEERPARLGAAATTPCRRPGRESRLAPGRPGTPPQEKRLDKRSKNSIRWRRTSEGQSSITKDSQEVRALLSRAVVLPPPSPRRGTRSSPTSRKKIAPWSSPRGTEVHAASPRSAARSRPAWAPASSS